jgi:choline dehydrogenase-like flavoprotein
LIEGAPMVPMLVGGFINALGEERQALMQHLPHMSNTGALLHDGFDLENPEEGAVITLKPSGEPQIDYPWTERLVEGLRAASLASLEIQLAGGATQVGTPTGAYARNKAELERALAAADFAPTKTSVFVAHCMGGCAMGKDPMKSVVDSKTLRHHDLDNLFVVDGSVYPTSLTVNPQISIYGLASWAAQHVEAAVA